MECDVFGDLGVFGAGRNIVGWMDEQAPVTSVMDSPGPEHAGQRRERTCYAADSHRAVPQVQGAQTVAYPASVSVNAPDAMR